MKKQPTETNKPATPRMATAELKAFLAAHPQAKAFTLVFTDLCGVARGKVLRREEMQAAYETGRFIPESITSLDTTGADVVETGLVWERGDPDRIARPVSGSLTSMPWVGPQAAQFLVSISDQEGRPVFSDPRNLLERVIGRFDELALTPVVAVELEFYLIDRDSAAAERPTPPRPMNGLGAPKHLQACLLSDLEDFRPFFDDLYGCAEEIGLPARTLISEYAPGQMEVVLQHRADALRAADEAILLKRLVKGVAEKHGYLAAFMAKPYAQYSGSGMHIHCSLATPQGDNAFADPDPAGNALMRQAIGGLKETMGECMGIWAPTANSYRRFRKASYAPLAATWGVNNRSVSLRIPSGPPASRHIEHRVAGADANPYLAVAAVLAGVHKGIEETLDPGDPVTGNGYEQAHAPLPSNWFSALAALRGSAFLRDYLGEQALETFCTIKEVEADRFFAEPSELDFRYYLRTV